MNVPHWKRRSSTYLIESPYLKIRRDEIELPDGSILPEYYIREARGFAIVFARTVSGKNLLIEQYRYAADDVGVELVAGSLESDEEPLHCAQRELLEETGYEATHWERIGEFRPDPVRSTSTAHLFLARDARPVGDQRLEPTENIVSFEASDEELRAAIRDGRMHSGPSLAAVALAIAHGVLTI